MHRHGHSVTPRARCRNSTRRRPDACRQRITSVSSPTTPPATTRLPANRAAITGVVAVAAAIAAGHLVAGLLLTPSASPFFAVGNAAVNRTPAAVKDFAIRNFGTGDKAALLIGMAVVLVLVGALAGLASRRTAVPGLIVVVVLGAVGALAVGEHSTRPLGYLAPAAALIAGGGVFWGL